MASNVGAIATKAPPFTLPTQAFPANVISQHLARPPKRRRQSISDTSCAFTTDEVNLLGPHTKFARLSLSTNVFLPSLASAVALVDDRRRWLEEYPQTFYEISDNPSCRRLLSLMSGGTQIMGRSSEMSQVAPTAPMNPSNKGVNASLSMPRDSGDFGGERSEISPQSPTSIAGATVTESPMAMDVDDSTEPLVAQQVALQEERPQPGSMSYPGSLQSSSHLTEPPTRGMSFPMPSPNQISPLSLGGKRHKCPYCNTEFTRHHNLKSHLLTHSQEKPYVCTECQMRFRRLHDLKRHGKLHTGEKPHVCPKCDRKFARGDALARHSKGAGGCAGRRSSMGSFADGDELDGAMGECDEPPMAGIAYDNRDEEGLRRQSLPSMNTQHIPNGQGDHHSPHARTYPPAGARTTASGLYAPNLTQKTGSITSSVPNNSMAGSHTSNASISSAPMVVGNTILYSQSGMTETSKPMSPGFQGHGTSCTARQRSPSLSQTLQQQQAGSRHSDLHSPHNGRPRPKLPGLSHPGFAASNANLFSHGRVPSGTTPSGESGNMFAQSDPSVWAYIQTLEDKVKSLSEKVVSLDHELGMLKRQLENREGEVIAG